MLQYKKVGKIVETSGYKLDALMGLIHIPAEITFSFTYGSKADVSKTFTLSPYRNKPNQIQIIEDQTDKQNLTYDELLRKILPYFNEYEMQVIFDKDDFQRLFPLWTILEKIQSNVARNVIFMNYMDGMFHFVLKPSNKSKLNEIYFWDSNSSMFAFDDDGPRFIFEDTLIGNDGKVTQLTIDSILDIIGA